MLKVFVELHPYGDATRAKPLAEFDIANNGTGTLDSGNYDARYEETYEWIKDVVKNYPRMSTDVLRLVYEVLKKRYDSEQ